jgi:hypothetical protein
MNSDVIPEQSYTRAWSDGRGEVKFFTRSDGSRLRYFTAGTGPPLAIRTILSRPVVTGGMATRSGSRRPRPRLRAHRRRLVPPEPHRRQRALPSRRRRFRGWPMAWAAPG